MDFSAKKPTVFITGYSGFTGRYLAAAMRTKGYEVHGLVRNKSQSIYEHSADLSNQNELFSSIKKIKPDYVIHLAAISFVAHGCAADFYQTNLMGTLNLLEAIKAAGITPKKIIIASSANVYGNPEVEVISEKTLANPINHYANSKLAMENLAKLYFDQFAIVITRPFNYTGPGQTENFLISKIAAHFRNNIQTIKLGNLDVIRDISDISFLIESYIQLLTSSVHSEIINICSGVGYSLLDIIEMFQEISGYKIKIEVDPSLVRANEIKKLVGCNKKLTLAIGEIQKTNIFDLLEKMYLNHTLPIMQACF